MGLSINDIFLAVIRIDQRVSPVNTEKLIYLRCPLQHSQVTPLLQNVFAQQPLVILKIVCKWPGTSQYSLSFFVEESFRALAFKLAAKVLNCFLFDT